MDTDNVIALSGNGKSGENGIREQLPVKWDEGISSEQVNGTLNDSSEIEGFNENFESALKLNDNSFAQEAEGSVVPAESNGVTVSKVVNIASFFPLLVLII